MEKRVELKMINWIGKIWLQLRIKNEKRVYKKRTEEKTKKEEKDSEWSKRDESVGEKMEDKWRKNGKVKRNKARTWRKERV